MKSLIGINPVNKDVLVGIYDDGEKLKRLSNGQSIILLADDGLGPNSMTRSTDVRHSGIRPRWGVVLATTDYAEERGLQVGQKVLMETMKWSRGIPYDGDPHGKKFWRIAAEDVVVVDETGFDDDEKAKITEMYPDITL